MFYTNFEYDEGFDFECEYEAPDMVPRALCVDAAEALHNVIEELYNSANSINRDRIRGSLAYLCDALKVSDELLRDEEGLDVVHWKEVAREAARQRIKEKFIDERETTKWLELAQTLTGAHK